MDILPQDNTPRKQCKGPCGRILPHTPEYFHRNGKSGLHPRCKACISIKSKAAYRQPGEHERALAYSQAYRERPGTREKRYADHKEWRQRPEVKARQSEYYKTYKAEYYSVPENRLRRNEQSVAQRIRRLEEKREAERVYSANRRAVSRTIPGKHTPQQIQDLLKRQKHQCYYCFTKFEKKAGKYLYHVDHTYPLYRVEGTGIPANDINYLVLACPHCNASKHDRFPWEWPEGGRLL